MYPKLLSIFVAINLAFSLTDAVPIAQKRSDDTPDGVVKFALKPKAAAADLKHNTTIIARENVDETVWTNLKQKILYYALDIDIGTAGQTVTPLVDTGSSDLWVYTPKSGVSQPTYDPTKSSTYKYVDDKFSIQYVKGSAAGNFVTDNIAFQGITIKDQKFATIDKDENGPSVLGIGFTGGEASIKAEGVYPNLPQSLVDQGIIKSNAYSLFLDKFDQTTDGELLFGGVDTSKYTGPLYTVNVTRKNALFTTVDSFDGYNVGFETGLDSGTSLAYVPTGLFDYIVAKHGLQPNSFGSVYSTDTLPDDLLDVTFSGATFKIPLANFFLPAKYVLSSPYDTLVSDWVFVLQPSTQSQNINLFGDLILQSLYVVYDLAGHEISIAQSSTGTGDGEILAIPAAHKVPGAVRAPNY